MIKVGNAYYKKDPKVQQNDLFEAVLETTKRQIEKCGLYRQLCKQKNFDPKRDLKSYADIKNIPYLSTANFKGKSGRPKELLCVPENEIRFYGTSSGTSGDPSLLGRDNVNIHRVLDAGNLLFPGLCDLPKYKWALMFMPPAAPFSFDAKGAPGTGPWMLFILNVLAQLALPPSEIIRAMKLVDPNAPPMKRFAPDPEIVVKTLMANPKSKGPGWITGSVPLLYRILTEISKKTGQTFKLDEKSIIAIGGGWKTFTGEAVPKDLFRKDLSNILGIGADRIHDIYAFTETDIVFCECSHHQLHVPPWGDLIPRDFKTLEPVKSGEKGLANIINPLAYSYAGVSIMQDDVVRITREDGCPCGNHGKTFEVMGRAEGAESKGCGAQVAEMANM